MIDSTVEAEFKKSWERAEEFYTGWLTPMSGLVKELRSRGYDRLFRHGHTAYLLVLSRSLKHGLRGDQPSIMFFPQGDGTLHVHCELRGPRGLVPRTFTLPSVALTPELDRLLGRLAQEQVD